MREKERVFFDNCELSDNMVEDKVFLSVVILFPPLTRNLHILCHITITVHYLPSKEPKNPEKVAARTVKKVAIRDALANRSPGTQ